MKFCVKTRVLKKGNKKSSNPKMNFLLNVSGGAIFSHENTENKLFTFGNLKPANH